MTADSWDAAVTRHLMATNPSSTTCFYSKCGIYFSDNGCTDGSQISSTEYEFKEKRDSASKVACLYCDYKLCLSWNGRRHSGSCNHGEKREKQAI